MTGKMQLLIGACAALTMASGCANQPAPPATATVSASTKQDQADCKALNHLTAILIDAGSLYREAAAKTDDPDLKRELGYLAGEREGQVAQFQEKVSSLNGVPAESGEALGVGHRLFTDIRAAFEDDNKVAAREVLRGEEYLLDEVSKTAEDTALSADTRAFAQNYIAPISADRDRLEQLAKNFGADL